jgi:FkbM family methyltransferase
MWVDKILGQFPFLRRVQLARLLRWQAQFLSSEGRRGLTWWLAEGSMDEITFRRGDVTWTVYASDRSVGQPLFQGFSADADHSRRVTEWLRTRGRLAARDYIVEVGANIGSSTIPMLRSTDCRVLAIEPVPATAALLRRNLEQNGLSGRVTILECAIGDAPGGSAMVVFPAALGGSELHVANAVRTETWFHGSSHTVPVRIRTLDQVLRSTHVEPSQVAFVWADVQGSEGSVIRTGEELWRAGVPLWAEVAPILIRRQGDPNRFLEDAERNFRQFIPTMHANGGWELTDSALRPISEFRAFFHSLDDAAGSHGDAMLVP